MRRFLVSAFLAEVTQQIHSLRANGVNVFQRSSARGSATIAFWKSSGSLCTTHVRLPFKLGFNKLNFGFEKTAAESVFRNWGVGNALINQESVL